MKLALVSLLVFSSSSVFAAQHLNGLWDGSIQYDDYKIPFPVEFKQSGNSVSVSFFNGDDRVTSTSGSLQDGLLKADFAHYATHLEATLTGGVLKGTYGGPRSGSHEFEAKPHTKVSFPNETAPSIHGLWNLPNESPKGEHAWRLIIRQKGAEASAAILRVDGDTGALTGRYEKDRFVLNHFDGARASVMEIVPKPDGTLDVALKGFHNPTKHFTAVRQEQIATKGLPQPTDPGEHTRVSDPNEPFRFSFPDLSGKLVSNNDRQLRDKVVLVNVTGSWCPNCHDEAPFLAELYRKYHAAGLEIVALDFEEPEQLQNPTRLHAFIKQYGISYTYLLAGEPSELAAKIPQAVNLNAWPTTFFLGRDGRVRSVHAGFAGPSTGKFNRDLKQEITGEVEQLLAGGERASR